jgi:ribosome biogenesis ATPase
VGSLNSYRQERPTTRFVNVAGVEGILTQIREQVFYPVHYASLYQHLRIAPPSGLLLHGPSGCGKTLLASSIAGELGLPFFKVSGPELIGGTSGESEQRIRTFFQNAIDAAPSIIFIDALDVLAGKRDSSQRGMDRRVVAQLFDCIDSISADAEEVGDEAEAVDGNAAEDDCDAMDTAESSIQVAEGFADAGSGPVAVAGAVDGGLSDASPKVPKKHHVIFIAATNRPESIDLGVRGRFAKEIALPVPDAPARSQILRLLMKHVNTEEGINWAKIGKMTPGFVGADLRALSREAGTIAVRRIVTSSSMEPLLEDASSSSSSSSSSIGSPFMGSKVEMADLTAAIQCVQPSAKREGFAVVPDVSWDDVGALVEVREELIQNVLEPIAHPERFRRLGLEVPAGVLFFGPPGCGKTLLAKALANYSGANFISVKGPELLNMYVGESESRVRQVFARARASVPCVIFFDELDALCPKRGSSDSGGNGVSERVVNQLLTELDGLEVRKDVYVIAATNRLQLIDDAMLRPGRLGKLLYVPLPNTTDRASILAASVKKVQLNTNPDPTFGGIPNFDSIAADPRTEGFSGADLAALVREAGMAVMRELRDSSSSSTTDGDGDSYAKTAISAKHFELALQRVRPSVTKQDRDRYGRVHDNLKGGMGAIEALVAAGK